MFLSNSTTQPLTGANRGAIIKSMKPLVIFFAGPTAAGKSQMAYWLSEQFGLPIFSTDSVRQDTKVYKDVIDINEALEDFEKAKQWRIKQLLEKKKPFIYDGSVDRRWPQLKKMAEDAGFGWLLIDFDLSSERLQKNRRMFDRIENDELFNSWIADHQKFHEQFDSDAQLHITDENYQKRDLLASDLVKKALNS